MPAGAWIMLQCGINPDWPFRAPRIAIWWSSGAAWLGRTRLIDNVEFRA